MSESAVEGHIQYTMHSLFLLDRRVREDVVVRADHPVHDLGVDLAEDETRVEAHVDLAALDCFHRARAALEHA